MKHNFLPRKGKEELDKPDMPFVLLASTLCTFTNLYATTAWLKFEPSVGGSM